MKTPKRAPRPFIMIRLDGGLVQWVSVWGIWGAVDVQVRDYDTEGCTVAELRVDPDGEEYRPHYPNVGRDTALWRKPGRRARKWIQDERTPGRVKLLSPPDYVKLENPELFPTEAPDPVEVLREALSELLRFTVDDDLAHGIALTKGERDARTKALRALSYTAPRKEVKK